MTTETYCVTDYEARFESAESRKIKRPSWVAVPNKHDGLGFRLVGAHERSCELYAAWILILQVASKQPVRGRLHNGHCPLTARHLSIMTGFPEPVFDLAFQVLTSAEIGWLTVEPVPESAPSPGTPARHPGTPGDDPALAPGAPGRAPGKPVIDEMRGDEMRRDEREGGNVATSAPSRSRPKMGKPSIEDVKTEFEVKGLTESEALDQAETFVAFYESNGWVVGKRPMKSWRHAVVTWIKRRGQVENQRNGTAPVNGSRAVYALKAKQDAVKEEIKAIDNRTSHVATGPLYSAEDKQRRRELGDLLGTLNRELASV